jgi:DNA-binding PadR family transcriptional regulator
MPPVSHTSLYVLQALARGSRFGFEVMDATELPSGTIYPALRRLESMGLLDSDWEPDAEARAAGRPRRRYYTLTADGRAQLATARARARVVARLFGHATPRKGRA